MNSSFSEHEVADARLYQFDSEIDHDELATKKKKKNASVQTFPDVSYCGRRESHGRVFAFGEEERVTEQEQDLLKFAKEVSERTGLIHSITPIFQICPLIRNMFSY